MVFWFLTDLHAIRAYVRRNGLSRVRLAPIAAQAPPRLYGIEGQVLTLEAAPAVYATLCPRKNLVRSACATS